jgi:Fe-S-cluster containining protein
VKDDKQAVGIPCFRCGECCRRYQVLLERVEVEQLADYRHVSPEDFIALHADRRWPGSNKWLVKQLEGCCPFLRGDDKEFLCAVHEVKPRACREWAASLEHPECRRGLKNYWHLEVGRGQELHGTEKDIKEFEKFLNHCE